MKTLFITTQTNDIHNLVDAWDLVNVCPAKRFEFHYQKAPKNNLIINAAQKAAPEVIFYIGGCDGVGLPSIATFRNLRRLAPVINMIPDAGDPPWHRMIEKYRQEKCFDLYVGLDGSPDSPVDHVTVTPVNFRPFEIDVEKNIRCGFSGTLGGKRDGPLKMLGSRCQVRVRDSAHGDYADHAHFLKRCQLIFNTAWTGSGEYYHVKGRVIEAGFAGAALLEDACSPIDHWFPEGAYFRYSSGDEALEIIMNASHDDIAERAAVLSQVVREKYNPMTIYKGILDKLGIENPFLEPCAAL